MKGLHRNLPETAARGEVDVDVVVSSLVSSSTSTYPPGRTREMVQAVEALPEVLRVLLSLRYVEALADHEIAWLLHVPEPRVVELHAEALRALQTALRR